MKPETIHPFKRARRAGVPIMGITTADPAATIRSCAAARNGKEDNFLMWDCIGGLTGYGPDAEAIASNIGSPAETQNLVQMLASLATNAPKNCSVFISNAHKALNDYTALQAIWNLRDVFKTCGSVLVLLGPSLSMPPELSADAPVFEEPAPSEEQIGGRIEAAVNAAKQSVESFPAPTSDERKRITGILTGLPSVFSVEQSLALSLTKDGIDTRQLWELKVASLRDTAGLEISQPTTRFADMAGCFGAKNFFGKMIAGRQPFRGVFFLDEIEKMLAGGAGDLSGTSQAMIEQFLFWTEAKKVLAVLLLGVPGSGKSWTAQCVAGEAGVPLLRGSMSTVKGSLVGESEQNMKRLLKTVDSVTQEQTLMIATCNSLSVLSPEILARFKCGVFFYDYPTPEELENLWELYVGKYDLKEKSFPKVSKWVGREVESCCHLAWLFKSTLAEASASIVPVSRANEKSMTTLRQSASGRFLSAATIGVYDCKSQDVAEGRKVSL